jgi:restriction system protein
MVFYWSFWAVIRLILFFNPEPNFKSLLILEPLSTILFFITGLLIIALWVGQIYWRRSHLRTKALRINSAADLADLSPVEYEDLIVELYRALGHQAKRTGTVGDHGVDVVVRAKNGEKWVIQCKRWRKPVGESVVRDFYGVVQHEKAAQGAIIAVSGFSQPAIEWARGKPIYLYSGEDFLRIWKRSESQPSNQSKTT